MALTAQEFEQLKIHWPLVIQTIYPAIVDIPKGDGVTIADLLATWRGPLAKPGEAAIEDALLNTVLPAITAIEQAQADKAAAQQAVIVEYASNILKDKTPAQIKTYIENQITGWATLADAKADLLAWLPLIAAGLAWMVLEDD